METGRPPIAQTLSDDVEMYNGNILWLEDCLNDKVTMLENNEKHNAFFLADLGEIFRKLEDWRRLLPRVEPFYAIKCNSHPSVARFLADAGIGFDCASKAEIEQVLKLGVPPSRIVYANTCKQSSYITFAASNNVDLMTFDDVSELVKIKNSFPNSRLILRIQSCNQFKVHQNFNIKFGCHQKHLKTLLVQARSMEMDVVGVSFHVGSCPDDPDAFASAIENAHKVFKISQNLGFNMSILDIGGGFPGNMEGNLTFEKAALAITEALDKFFPESEGIRIIAEPGRYFVTSAFTLVVNIIGKKVILGDDMEKEKKSIEDPSITFEFLFNGNNGVKIFFKGRTEGVSKGPQITCEDNKEQKESISNMYFINDGIYGAFANVPVDRAIVRPQALCRKTQNNFKTSTGIHSVVWGPSCCSYDCVVPECKLPDLEIGQWLYFRNMGAYTTSLATNFNGIETPLLFFVCSLDAWSKVYGRNARLASLCGSHDTENSFLCEDNATIREAHFQEI